VYILFSKRDAGLYIGFTADLKVRLKQHSQEQVSSTKNRTPLKLTHYEYYLDKKDAQAREKYLKSGYGRRQIENFLQHTPDYYRPSLL